MKKINEKFKYVFLGVILLFSFFVLLATFAPLNPVFADDVDELQKKSDDLNQKLKELDAEIAKQKYLLENTSGQAQTLTNTVNQLEASKRKLETEIQQTSTAIEKTKITIQQLGLEIKNKEVDIQNYSQALSESIRLVNDLEQYSFVEKFLNYKNISDFWNDFEQTEKIRSQFHNEVDELNELRADLTKTEGQKRLEADNLSLQKTQLSSEQQSVEYTKKEKEKILAVTKNQEAEYQKLLEQTLAEKRSFEEELYNIESKLKFLIEPGSYPDPRKGILNWPLETIRITQYFGKTDFAKNTKLYTGKFAGTHNGVDFGTPIGTKVLAVADGEVIGLDNTDWYPGCRSWGGWVLVRHNNGLSSLYGHLSAFTVKVGDKVKTGQVIALSGNTGISTGPHLHLSIYASQGVKVGYYKNYMSGTGCSATNAQAPFADLSAYLDPMNYLPSIY